MIYHLYRPSRRRYVQVPRLILRSFPRPAIHAAILDAWDADALQRLLAAVEAEGGPSRRGAV